MDASGYTELHGLLLSLPADVLHHFFTVVPPRLLAILSCCCRGVRDELKACDWVWREHSEHTWQTWSRQARSAANDRRTSWRSLFAARKAVRTQAIWAFCICLRQCCGTDVRRTRCSADKKRRALAQMEREASHLLLAMEDPRERHACMRSLHAFGADILVITALALPPGQRCCRSMRSSFARRKHSRHKLQAHHHLALCLACTETGHSSEWVVVHWLHRRCCGCFGWWVGMGTATQKGNAVPARRQEFLSQASAGDEPLLLGRRYFAGMALVRVQSLRCAERMRQLLARPGAETRLEEGALLLVRGSA